MRDVMVIASVADAATIARSARLHTVRATWANAAPRVPPGRMNSFRGNRSSSNRSTSDSSRSTCVCDIDV